LDFEWYFPKSLCFGTQLLKGSLLCLPLKTIHSFSLPHSTSIVTKKKQIFWRFEGMKSTNLHHWGFLHSFDINEQVMCDLNRLCFEFFNNFCKAVLWNRLLKRNGKITSEMAFGRYALKMNEWKSYKFLLFNVFICLYR
jgi:hypothetical protein